MKHFEKILLYLECPETAAASIAAVAHCARANHATLTIAGTIEPTPWHAPRAAVELSASYVLNAQVAELEEELEALCAPARELDLDVSVRVLVGDPTKELVRAVSKDGYDVLIKPSEPHLAGLDNRLLRSCPTPVVVLRVPQGGNGERIVAAIEFDPHARQNDALNWEILDAATALALSGYRELHIVHVWSFFGEETLRHNHMTISPGSVDELVAAERHVHEVWLKQLCDDYRRRYGSKATDYLSPQVHLVKGEPRHIIPDQVKALKGDLLVLGSITRTGIPGLLMSNTAEAVLNKVDCSVMTVKPPGFVTPITAQVVEEQPSLF